MFDMLTSPYTHPLKKLIWMRMKASARAVWDTITGNPVTFSAIAAPLKQLSVAFSPVQDLHGYDAPWPAGGGVNKLPPAGSTAAKTDDKLTVTPFADGHYHIKKTAGQYGNNVLFDLLTPVDVTTDMYFTPIATVAGNGNMLVDLFDANSTKLTNAYVSKPSSSITYDGTATKIRFYFNPSSEYEGDVYPMVTATTVSPSTIASFTPYSNICPISGWDGVTVWRTGKNLLDIDRTADTSTGALTPTTEWTVDPTKYLVGYANSGTRNSANAKDVAITATASGTTVYMKSVYAFYGVLFSVPVRAGMELTLTVGEIEGSGRVAFNWIASDGTVAASGTAVAGNSHATATAPANAAYLGVVPQGSANGATPTIHDIMVTLGSDVPTSFTPYDSNSRSISLSFGSTLYSGTLDVLTGVVTVDVGYTKLLSSWTWHYGTATGGFPFCYTTNITIPNELDKLRCNCLKTVTQNGPIGITRSGMGYLQAFVKDLGCESADDFKAFLNANDVYVAYPLATPLTIQLTPEQVSSLAGENVMWSNMNGDLTVTYRSS